MNLFKSKPAAAKSPEASGEEQDLEDESSITIEDQNDKKKLASVPDDTLNVMHTSKMQKSIINKSGVKKQSKTEAEKKADASFEQRKADLISKLVKPMGNPAELEKILIQQIAQMNNTNKDEIIISSEPYNDINL